MQDSLFGGIFPAFGSYSKTYMGLSHLPALAKEGAKLPLPATIQNGARFDCVVLPCLHSSLQPMPNTTTAGTCHPFTEMSADFSRVHYRYELGEGPGEAAYAELRFLRRDMDSVLIVTDFVNNTPRSLDCVLNYFFTLDYPQETLVEARLPHNVLMVAGEDHRGVRFAQARPWDQQQPDATRAGVYRDPDFTGGYGFGDRVSSGHVPHLKLQPFGAKAGDEVTFELPFKAEELAMQGFALALRCKTVPLRPEGGGAEIARQAAGLPPEKIPEMGGLVFELSGAAAGFVNIMPGDALRLHIASPGQAGFAWVKGSLLTLTSLGGAAGVEVDCLLLGPEEALCGSEFKEQPLLPAPLDLRDANGCYELIYPQAGARYAFEPFDSLTRLRKVYSGCLEDAEPMRVSNPHFTFDDLQKSFSGSFPRKQSKPGLWVNVLEGDITVLPGSRVRRVARLSFLRAERYGKTNQPRGWQEHAQGRPGPSLPKEENDYLANALPEQPADSAKGIELGMGILKATLLQNQVFPIYHKDGWICHFTPGKRWDNLYTWDGGFIALGLITQDRRLAEYMLDLYLAPPDDPEQAFVHHGSPVPVQWMALRELVATAADDAERLRLLARYYRRARLYYEFLAGRAHGSTTDKFKTGLLSTYDYFYSAHGMDDYPAQLHTHLRGLQGRVAPAITASQVMLGGLTLGLLGALFAELSPETAMEMARDRMVYNADTKRLSQALLEHSWDEESGYYTYVVHDETGKALGALRDEQGINLDQGFDGLYPLVPLGRRAPHAERLLSHLMDESELLTPYGLTAVSQSAPYFTPSGYWNGAVWYPHAWYFGRALLDMGQGAFLLELVQRQLAAWSAQAEARWNSYEMLRLKTGEGAWHPTFSGLTSPLLNWAQSLSTPGTITTGLQSLVVSREEEGGCLRIRMLCRETGENQLWLAHGEKAAFSCGVHLLSETDGIKEVSLVFHRGENREEATGAKLPCRLELLRPGLTQACFIL